MAWQDIAEVTEFVEVDSSARYDVPAGCSMEKAALTGDYTGRVHLNKNPGGFGWNDYDLLCRVKPCVLDACPHIFVRGAGEATVEGVYSRLPSASCSSSSYYGLTDDHTSGSWSGWVNAMGARVEWNYGQQRWQIVVGGSARYYNCYPGLDSCDGDSTTFPTREYSWYAAQSASRVPTVSCVGPAEVVWTSHGSGTFTIRSEVTTTEARAVSESIKTGVNFKVGTSIFKASASYRRTTERTTKRSLTRTETDTTTCGNPCNSSTHHLWSQELIVAGGAVASQAPHCGHVSCVLATDFMGPKCPIEYCGPEGGNLHSGCQCCTSLEFMDAALRDRMSSLLCSGQADLAATTSPDQQFVGVGSYPSLRVSDYRNPRYVVSTATSNRCEAEGLRTITDVDKCTEAALELGLREPGFTASEYNHGNHKFGCSLYTEASSIAGDVRLHTGGGDVVDSSCNGDTWPYITTCICETPRAFAPGPYPVELQPCEQLRDGMAASVAHTFYLFSRHTFVSASVLRADNDTRILPFCWMADTHEWVYCWPDVYNSSKARGGGWPDYPNATEGLQMSLGQGGRIRKVQGEMECLTALPDLKLQFEPCDSPPSTWLSPPPLPPAQPPTPSSPPPPPP